MIIGIPGIPCGNFASVVRMIEKCGGSAAIVPTPAELTKYDKVVLAGVGAFDYGMSSIRDAGWEPALREMALERRVPVLGICLGMQLLCSSSEEGTLPGLNWIDAAVTRFVPPPGSALKVPHMGWNRVQIAKPNPLIPQGDEEQRFYFVHSYFVTCTQPEDVLARAHHGNDFAAALSHGNIYGVQFHPEKSHRFGMGLMRRFVELPC